MFGKKETTGSSKVKASHQDQMMLQHRLKKTSTKGDIIVFRNSLFASPEPLFSSVVCITFEQLSCNCLAVVGL
ncbi:hypothetical protein BDA96_03G026700 [Sorghum bicolor]|jgi:hypothetical protein|uniref:Uncharacterized protein n=2 Tax=Sorghum bicolor TaxID=4558 RepID=A0A921RAV7_SORBI|nr:hypothetical protein BDA96_03G026700 [Sorghum bicolor]OQU86131.1 hypothetical protein SORBI_3003G024450 [Sorghum bicolor]